MQPDTIFTALMHQPTLRTYSYLVPTFIFDTPDYLLIYLLSDFSFFLRTNFYELDDSWRR